jgi:hypothetical protein
MRNQDYYEDLIAAFMKATPSVRGTRLVEAPSETRRRETRKRPEEKFTDIVTGTRVNLNQQYHERLHQARTTFIVALAALIFGILLVFVGAILTFTISLPIGIVTTISSTIVEVVSALALKFHRDTNDRLDHLSRDLHKVELTTLSMEYISRISDPKAHDEAIADLIQQLNASDLNATTSLTPPDDSKKPDAFP